MGLYIVGCGLECFLVLLVLDYNLIGDKEALVYVCLVGKGIIFDFGGYSIKQIVFMDLMKLDMGGAVMVIGVLVFVIMCGLNKCVKLFFCCVDNLISGNVFKLGDIIIYCNGKKVEVMNIDVEGCLVFVDGLIDVSVQKLEMIIDAVIFIGAVKIVLGNDYYVLFSFDDVLVGCLLVSVVQENELFWCLLLVEFYCSQLLFNFVELNNIGSAVYLVGVSMAVGFLLYFVENYQ